MFWTIPPLSAATEGPWITPRGCQPKKRQEGLLVFQAKTVCSQRWNPDSKRVGVHQQSAYFIHRVAINFFVFRGTTPTSLWFVCPCYYLGWVAVKMFGFKKKKKKGMKDDWCGGEKGWRHYNHCPDVELDLTASAKNTHMVQHTAEIPVWTIKKKVQ